MHVREQLKNILEIRKSLDFILNVNILLMYIMEYMIPEEIHSDKLNMKSVMFYMR